MNELKPCPFCGGEARQHAAFAHGVKSRVGVYVECDGCGACSNTSWCEGAQERSAAAWNSRAERTCRYVRDHMGVAGNWFCKCSECGAEFDERVVDRHFVFCPNCGARVEVDE